MLKVAYYCSMILNPKFKKCSNIKGFHTLLKDTLYYVYSEKENIDTLDASGELLLRQSGYLRSRKPFSSFQRR